MGTARQAPHPRKAELERASRLPPVARGGARSRSPQGAPLPGSDSGAVPPRPPVPGHETARRVARLRPRRTRNGPDPPERHPPPKIRENPPAREQPPSQLPQARRQRALKKAKA